MVLLILGYMTKQFDFLEVSYFLLDRLYKKM